MMMLSWHWFVLGVSLVLLELFLASFTVVWFGVSAVIVALCLWLIPALSFNVQLILWAVISVLCTALWFSKINPHLKNRTLSLQSIESAIGQRGLITAYNPETKQGKIRFTTPVLGASEWSMTSEEALTIGEYAQVMQIAGNQFIVKKH